MACLYARRCTNPDLAWRRLFIRFSSCRRQSMGGEVSDGPK